MAKSYNARLTRDVTIRIRMENSADGATVAEHSMEMTAGTRTFRKAAKRAAWIAAINAEHPGAALAL